MPPLNRRNFCTLSGLSLLGLPSQLLAHENTVLQPERGLVLFRQAQPASRTHAERMAAQGWETCMLEPDLVRQWRGGLGESLEQGRLLLGHSDWDDWLLLRGLAAEQRRFPLHEERLGRTVYSWILG